MNETEAQIQAYAQEIDLSLLRENLQLTPKQRLQQLDNLINDLQTLRHAMLNRTAVKAP
jgi:hypothetical protein